MEPARMRLAASARDQTEPVQEAGSSTKMFGNMKAAGNSTRAATSINGNGAELKAALRTSPLEPPRKAALSALDDVGR